MWRRPTALARLATAATAIVVVVVLALIPPSRFCVELNVAASFEKSKLLALLADQYEAQRPAVNGRCVNVVVSRVASGEAEAALIATYYAGGGKADGSAPETRTLALMRAVENSVVHYGDTVATYLKDLLACDDRGQAEQCVSAIAIEEKQVWDYNHGNPTSDVPAPRGVVPSVP